MQCNLCRCGVYLRVVRAVQGTAGQIQNGPMYEVKDLVLQTPSIPEVTLPPLPLSLQRHPNLDDWMHIREDGTVGQGAGARHFARGKFQLLTRQRLRTMRGLRSETQVVH